jgi:hypothetical protein
LRYRRFRDVYHTGDDSEIESPAESTPADESQPPPKVDDPQLRRAIEYLQGKLKTPQAA